MEWYAVDFALLEFRWEFSIRLDFSPCQSGADELLLYVQQMRVCKRRWHFHLWPESNCFYGTHRRVIKALTIHPESSAKLQLSIWNQPQALKSVPIFWYSCLLRAMNSLGACRNRHKEARIVVFWIQKIVLQDFPRLKRAGLAGIHCDPICSILSQNMSHSTRQTSHNDHDWNSVAWRLRKPR